MARSLHVVAEIVDRKRFMPVPMNSGACGICDDGYGPVEFAVLGDGKELWRSGVVKPGPVKAFSIPVGGVTELELRTRVTAAGAGGAWGAWLEPVLERG